MDNSLIQIGVGGAFALLMVREVLGFLKGRHARNGAKSAGEFPPEYWQAEQRKAVGEMLVTIVVPILTNEIAILNEMRKEHGETSRNIAVILDRLENRRRES